MDGEVVKRVDGGLSRIDLRVAELDAILAEMNTSAAVTSLTVVVGDGVTRAQLETLKGRDRHEWAVHRRAARAGARETRAAIADAASLSSVRRSSSKAMRRAALSRGLTAMNRVERRAAARSGRWVEIWLDGCCAPVELDCGLLRPAPAEGERGALVVPRAPSPMYVIRPARRGLHSRSFRPLRATADGGPGDPRLHVRRRSVGGGIGDVERPESTERKDDDGRHENRSPTRGEERFEGANRIVREVHSAAVPAAEPAIDTAT